VRYISAISAYSAKFHGSTNVLAIVRFVDQDEIYETKRKSHEFIVLKILMHYSYITLYIISFLVI